MREKLIELIGATHYGNNSVGENFQEGFIAKIADNLIANGVEIPVRCKNCKHRVEGSKMCSHPKAIGWDAIEPEDDDFCSYGEKED